METLDLTAPDCPLRRDYASAERQLCVVEECLNLLLNLIVLVPQLVQVDIFLRVS